jgi:hypothetical protein
MERASEINIEDLVPSANSEDRLPRLKICLDESILYLIALVIDIHRPVYLLAVAGGVNINAAAKDKSVISTVYIRKISRRRLCADRFDSFLVKLRLVAAGK